MVTGNDHQGAQDDLGVTGGLDSLDDVLAGGLLGLTLHRADEHVAVAQGLHGGLHLAVAHLCGVGGAVAHKDKGDLLLSGSVQAVETGILHSGSGNGLGNSFLVGVDDGSVGTDLAQQGLGNGDALELVLVFVDHLHHLVVLCTVHQVGGLDDHVLHAVGHSAVQSLLHVVDLLAVAGLNMVDDDLCGEGAADRPIGISGLQRILDALDILHSAVVEGGAEGDHQQLILADVVLIAAVVLGSIAGVATKVVGVSLFALNQLLLGIGQGIPCGLGGLTLGIGVIGALLHIDGIDQVCNVLCGQFVSLLAGNLAAGSRS